MSDSLPVLESVAAVTDHVQIQKVLADRGVPYAVYDFIKHNLGAGAALAAVLVGKYEPSERGNGKCRCG